VQRQVIEHALRDFRLAGVGLPVERKERFKAVMLELTQLQAKFEENVLDATNGWTYHVTDSEELRGLNEMLIEQARRKRAHEKRVEGWVLTLDQPTYVAVVTDAESATLRRAFYEAWTTRASDKGPNAGRWDNSEVMENILRLRHEAARLLDFRSYAEYALSTRMARTPRKSSNSSTSSHARRGRRRCANSRSSRRSPDTPFPPGTWASTPRSCSASRYSVSQEELRPYFPLPKVLTGLFEVAERLFGVRIRERQNAPVWHADVRFFEIENSTGQPSAASISMPTRAPTSAAARGWMSASAASSSTPARRCRSPISCATSCRRARTVRRS
jgi:oligopeptidase A